MNKQPNKQLILEIYKALLAGTAAGNRGRVIDSDINKAYDTAKKAAEVFEAKSGTGQGTKGRPRTKQDIPS